LSSKIPKDRKTDSKSDFQNIDMLLIYSPSRKQIGLVKSVPGMKALDMNAAEDDVVYHTKTVVPGMIVTGMEAAEAAGCALYNILFIILSKVDRYTNPF